MKRVYSDEERRELLARYKESGLPKAQFAKQNGPTKCTLTAWLKKELLEQRPLFVPVKIQKPHVGIFEKEHSGIEIAHSSGVKVSCSSATSVEWVAEFFRLLS